MNWKRSRTKSIFSGLPLRTIPKLFIVPWDCTIMVLNPSPVLPNSGFLLQFRIRGTRNLFLMTSLQHTKSLSPCHNVGIYMCRSPWCFEIPSTVMITLVNNPRASSMALAAHLIAHDAGVTLSELSPISTCSASTRFLGLRQWTSHSETRTVYSSCPLAITTSLIQTPVKFMSESVTPMRKRVSSSPECSMSENRETRLRRSLLHLPVVLHAGSHIDLL